MFEKFKVKTPEQWQIKRQLLQTFEKHESYGIIEKDDHIAETGEERYLPHRAIVKNKKTSKTRIAFDGSY